MRRVGVTDCNLLFNALQIVGQAAGGHRYTGAINNEVAVLITAEQTLQGRHRSKATVLRA